jgi:WD40 repeat protein
MRSLLTLCLIALLPAPVVAQGKQQNPDDPIEVVNLDRKDAVLYDKEVEPILRNRCFVCHSGKEKKGKLDMGTYETLIKGGKRGSPIVPGKSQDSLLVKMSGRTQKPFMPPKDEGKPLTPTELAIVKLWIDQGAKAPTGGPVVANIIVGVPPANVTPVRAVAVSPDKAFIVAGRGNQLYVYDGAKGDYLRTLQAPGLTTADKKPVQAAHLSIVEALAFSPDGKYLASGSFQEVCLWDVKTGNLEHRLTDFDHNVVAIAFSADSRLMATGGGAPTADGEVKVFEVGGRWKMITHIKNGHSDTVYGVSFSPERIRRGLPKIASCGADKFIKVFELPSGKFLKSFEGHTHHVLDVGWKSDGKLLASAGADNTVKIWDYEKGEQVRTINAHTKQITRLQFIGKTPQFVTCSGDMQIKFWNVDTGGNVRNFAGNNDYLYAVSVSADGTLLAAGGEEGVVRVYNAANAQLVRSLLPPGAVPEKK